jgi:hypothetical protein
MSRGAHVNGHDFGKKAPLGITAELIRKSERLVHLAVAQFSSANFGTFVLVVAFADALFVSSQGHFHQVPHRPSRLVHAIAPLLPG